MATYYDLILAFIPLVLLGLGGGLYLVGLAANLAVGIAGLVTLGLVGHALFINAPVENPSPAEHAERVENANQAISMSD